MDHLNEKKCKPCEGGVTPLNSEQAYKLLSQLSAWQLDKATNMIHKTFRFKGFLQTMSFVNAVAWIANQEGHHPDMEVGYNTCKISFTTHAIKGLSENDFICAAKIDTLNKK